MVKKNLTIECTNVWVIVFVSIIIIYQCTLSFAHLVSMHLWNYYGISLYAFVHETHVPHLSFSVCKTSVYEKWKCLMLCGLRRYSILLRMFFLFFSNSAHSRSFLISRLCLFRLFSNFLLNFELRKANWKQYSAIRLLVSTFYVIQLFDKLIYVIHTCIL